MHKRLSVFLVLFLAATACGKEVRGTVTYVAAGTIYTSLGADAGVRDSSIIYVLRGRDTVAALRITALSSKSSSAIVVSGQAKLSVGDIVVGITEGETLPPRGAVSASTVAIPAAGVDSSSAAGRPVEDRPPAIAVQGRISAQYLTTRYEDYTANSAQPALIVSLKASARDIPLTLDVYGNYKTITYGWARIFSAASVDQSRLYRLSLQYNDGANGAMVGRFVPTLAPAVGYIDGILLSRSFGRFLVGAAGGYQSKATLNGINTTYKKISAFANYQDMGVFSTYLTASYTRNYFHAELDREFVSALASFTSAGGLSLYFNGDLDFRQKQADQFVFDPTVTNLHATISYPLLRYLSLALGADMSRWYADYSLIRYMPDSLLDRTARVGVSIGVNLFTMRGLSASNTFTPRSSPDGFGKEYANVSSIAWSNAFSSGFMLRGNATFTANQYTSSRGFGGSIERAFLELFQFSLSFQRSLYTIISLNETNKSTSFSADALWFVTRDVTLSANVVRLDGFGRISTSLFTELSYRF